VLLAPNPRLGALAPWLVDSFPCTVYEFLIAGTTGCVVLLCWVSGRPLRDMRHEAFWGQRMAEQRGILPLPNRVWTRRQLPGLPRNIHAFLFESSAARNRVVRCSVALPSPTTSMVAAAMCERRLAAEKP
jgi:hypothetical protein